MKKCPYCGYENDEQAEVCERCKAAITHDKSNDEEPEKVSKRRKRSE